MQATRRAKLLILLWRNLSRTATAVLEDQALFRFDKTIPQWKRSPMPRNLPPLLALALSLACSQSTGSPVTSIPLQKTLDAGSLTAPVDVVRDQYGIPHIYGQSLGDVIYAQGYMMAMDRLVEIDIIRHDADGSLSSLLGTNGLSTDLGMRTFHLRAQAETGYANFKTSSDPEDQAIVTLLQAFAAGINAYVTDLKAGLYQLPSDFSSFYTPDSFQTWLPEDSLVLGEFQAFSLAFDPSSEIARSQLEAQALATFDQSSVPAFKARAGIGQDLQTLAPFDPTYTLTSSSPPAWTGFNGDTSTASRALPRQRLRQLARLYRDDLKSIEGLGLNHLQGSWIGSNNWVVAPSLSQSGHSMVANDTHLSLTNPPVFYLVHLVNTGTSFPLNIMGVAFAGIPGIILGMNQHIAWGATVNQIDVTDVYQEAVTPCGADGGFCVAFDGGQVPVQPRLETFNLSFVGQDAGAVTATYYDVPQHGPILPRILPDRTLDTLKGTELSVKYTGFTSAPLFKAVFGLNRAATMKDGIASLDKNFRYGGQNWVVGDDQGNIGWSQTIRVPRRAAGHAPWKVLPGDGTAEWGPDMDPHYIPHAYNPAQGFIATANNDPIGVTDKNDPFFSQPVVNWYDAGSSPSSPLYLGAFYDPGTRVGRITNRINAFALDGGKLSLDDMQSIQADATTEWGAAFAPLFVEISAALAHEAAAPGSEPDLSSLVTVASSGTKALFQTVHDWVAGWTFDTPTGVAEDNPTAQQIQDSQATLVMSFFISYLADTTLGDELSVPGMQGVFVDEASKGKLLADLCFHPEKLKTGLSDAGDPILFDDISTPPIESKRQTVAKSIIRALDGLVRRLGAMSGDWRWGTLHTLTLPFLLPVAPSLSYPPPTDPSYASGFPRHGENGTVDVGDHGLDRFQYQYGGPGGSPSGPAIRFVCELDPTNGPQARNVLPGGEVFDPASPHYADMMALWRKNKSIDLSYKDADVVKSANTEYQTNHLGRIRFQP
jgi:penicillin amidase